MIQSSYQTDDIRLGLKSICPAMLLYFQLDLSKSKITKECHFNQFLEQSKQSTFCQPIAAHPAKARVIGLYSAWSANIYV